MRTGIGVDILRIDRMRPNLDSAAFLRRTFTAGEIERGAGRVDQAIYYRKLFAAKEAVFKCFAISAERLGSWLEIEIIESNESAPAAVLHGAMADIAAEQGVEQVLVSLSAEADVVVACAAIGPKAVAG